MDVVYRVLGFAAAVGERLSRISFNFLQLNWLVMIGLAVLLGKATTEVRYALANAATPRAVSVAEVLQHRDLEHNFVAVSGLLLATTAYRDTTSRRGRTTVNASYQPLLDSDRSRGILVKRAGAVGDRNTLEATTVTGMLVPIDSDLREALQRDGGRIEQTTIDPDYVLEVGRAPGDLMTWSAISVGAAVALLALLVVWQRRYVVFRAAAHAPLTAPPGDGTGLDLRASGRFTLGPKQHRRFLATPAILAHRADGIPALLANVDASSRWFGIKTGDLAGTWVLELPIDAAALAESGYQYFGLRRRPGLRIRHTDAAGKRTTTVIDCADVAQCAAALGVLQAASTAAG